MDFVLEAKSQEPRVKSNQEWIFLYETIINNAKTRLYMIMQNPAFSESMKWRSEAFVLSMQIKSEEVPIQALNGC